MNTIYFMNCLDTLEGIYKDKLQRYSSCETACIFVLCDLGKIKCYLASFSPGQKLFIHTE